MIKEIQHYAGNYLEVDFLPFKRVPRHSRGARTKPTTQAQKILNQENRERKLYMLIHENFTSADYALHPTYSPGCLPASADEALRDRRNFIARLRRLYKKYGVEFKGIFVLEKSGRGRLHHHMIISGGVPRGEIERLWGLGTCNCDRLQFSEHGVVGLACYIVKSASDDEDDSRCTFKSYSHTRNLRKPPPPIVKAASNKEFNKLWDYANDRDVFEARYGDYFFVEAEKKESFQFGEKYLRVRLCRKDARLELIDDLQYHGCLNYRRLTKQ